MNREHKYRAWIEEDKQFIYFTLNDILERHFSYYGSCDIKILEAEKTQYINHKDKNGKEIYVGDIVEIVYDGVLETLMIVFDLEELDFKATNGKEEYGKNFQYLSCCDEVEVIGNKYEDIKLLKQNYITY